MRGSDKEIKAKGGGTFESSRVQAEREDSVMKGFKRERDAFFEMKERLFQREEYRGKFVAVFGGEVVDFDEDKRKLAERVYLKFGYVPIFIGKVQRGRRVVRIPSPRIRRR